MMILGNTRDITICSLTYDVLNLELTLVGPLEIIRLILANTKEFYNNHLMFKTTVLIGILRLTEI